MPEFEDFPATGEAPSAQKQIKPPTESGPSDRRPEPSSNPPMAPHRGQAIEYSPRRTDAGPTDSKGGPRRRVRNTANEGSHRVRRNIQIRSAYTKRTLPASIANMPKGPKGPWLLSRLKNFLLRLLKILRKKRQVPRGRTGRRGEMGRSVPPRRGPPGRRGRASNQANRRGSGGRRRGGSEGREGGSSQRTRNSPTGRDSQRGAQKAGNGAGSRSTDRRRTRARRGRRRRPNSSTE